MPQINDNVIVTKIRGTSMRQNIILLMKEEPWCVKQIFFRDMRIYVAFDEGPVVDLGYISDKYKNLLSGQIIFISSWKITGGSLLEHHRSGACARFGVNIKLILSGTNRMDKAIQVKRKVLASNLPA